MSSVAAKYQRAGSTGPDDLDNLFNYDNAVEDFLKDLPNGDNNNNDPPDTAGASKRQADNDELDKEIKEVKKRKPVPKLDEDRLLSDQGIPKLKRLAKTRVKFAGKGHEYSDISRLLNTYQLWLDDLYPRAKFRDALTMVEKVGHKKRLQVYRKAWIDESKPSRRELTPVEESGRGEGEVRAAVEPTMSGGLDGGAQGGEGGVSVENVVGGADDAPEEDELDALLAGDGGQQDIAAKPTSRPQPQRSDEHADEPDEDELDALMGMDMPQQRPATREPDKSQTARRKTGLFEDDDSDADELDALLDAQGAGSGEPHHPSAGRDTAPNHGNDNDYADDEDAMAEMGGDMW